jgi:hypothetical protein
VPPANGAIISALNQLAVAGMAAAGSLKRRADDDSSTVSGVRAPAATFGGEQLASGGQSAATATATAGVEAAEGHVRESQNRLIS